MDASYKIQRGIHVHLIQFFMCPEFWVHIILFSPHPAFLSFFIAITSMIRFKNRQAGKAIFPLASAIPYCCASTWEVILEITALA